MKQPLLLFFLLIACIQQALASLMYPLSTQQLVQNAEIVVKAVVVEKHSEKINNLIYTFYQLQVAHTFQGAAESSLTLAIEGGTLGNESMQSSASPTLQLAEEAIFFLDKAPGFYELSAYAQSVFRYDASSQLYHSPFLQFTEQELFGLFRQELGNNQTKTYPTNPSPTGNPLVMSVSPLSITAGTESILTILGTGFGSAQTGKVFFANPDDAGATYVPVLPSRIQLWSDTKITVFVPSQAGTGNVWVQQNGVTSKSTQTINITYSRSNAEKDSYQYQVNAVNQSKTGGYLVSLNTLFSSDTTASAAFGRALQNWRCNSGINFTISDTTEVDTRGIDNINCVRWAHKNELKPGVLGITYSYYSSCTNGYWYLTEFDMNFLDTSLWNFDTSKAIASNFDFESVVLHELGHAQQLSHVINGSNIMHYAIAPGSVKRVIDENSLACANFILTDSKKNGACGPAAHQRISSEFCSDVSFTYFNFEEPSFFPNPSDAILNISFNLPASSAGSIKVYDILGHELQTVYEGTFHAGKNSYPIELAPYVRYTGVYVAKVSAQNKTFLKKLIYLAK